MMNIQRLLCPVDLSETSHHALDHAIALARWYESTLIVLHVVHPAFLLEPPLLFADFDASIMTDAEQRVREEQIRSWLAPADSTGVETDIVFDEGNAAPVILERARTLHADLIVMGTHGASGFERVVLGSVAEKVLRKALCPVLTVPPRAATTAKLPYKRLLCPVDFSASSIDALRFAASLAEEADASLTILHVFDWRFDDEVLVERFDEPEFRRVNEEQARERLEALVTDDVRAWCTPVTKIAYGKAYQRILETAAELEADLIVIGVRGRNPVNLAIFGSTTNHVVRGASCPVLTLKR